MTKSSGSDAKNTLYCSFCGKSQHEVRKLIAGPTVFICDECVELCMDIIREEHIYFDRPGRRSARAAARACGRSVSNGGGRRQRVPAGCTGAPVMEWR